MYFTYKVRYTNSSTEIPEFPIAPEIALELLMAANFLDCWIHPVLPDSGKQNSFKQYMYTVKTKAVSTHSLNK